MLIRDTEKLKPITRELVEKGIKAYIEKYKRPLWINETFREKETQRAYYAQGRQPLSTVNTLRLDAKLPSITEKENIIVTKTEPDVPFPHGYGIAIDVVPADSKGMPNWNAPLSEWKAIAEVFKEQEIETNGYIYKLEWGGDWKAFQDNPHFQICRWKDGVKENWKKCVGI